MKISELIAAVGDDQVGVQNLDQCYLSAKTEGARGKRIGVISFGVQTSQVVDMLAGDESERVGLIVWLPRKKVREVMARAGAGTENGGALGTTRPTENGKGGV